MTLSALAREFDCTPSAISYVVRKAEAAGVEPGEPEAEPAPPQRPSVPAAVAPAPLATAAPAPAPANPVSAVPARPATVTLSLPDRSAALPSSQTRTIVSLPGNSQASAAAPPSPTPAAPVAPPAPTPGEPTRAATGEPGAARPGQPPPVDATEARLRETARSCLVAYRGWRQTPGETTVQTLNDAVHDLRKVLARIEIDMSASRREEPGGMRPIPVPPHRAARRR
jgi:hypothetical protein